MSTLLSSAEEPMARGSRPRVSFDTSIAYHHDPLLYIERQTRHLQQNIQSLLDAQSEGLVAGLSGAPDDDHSSTGVSSPTISTASSARGVPTIPVRQPAPKKISLRAARRGILRSMHEMLSLKEEEKKVISLRIEERRKAISEVDGFASKREGLQKTITDIQNSRDGERTEELKREARDLEREIAELESKLAELRTRHRHLTDEISQTENAVESKLSSYKESLSLLDKEVERYLRAPPLAGPLRRDTSGTTFYSLNPKRRTLDMAREHWQQEQIELRKRQRAVEREIRALNEGGPVWQSVINEITAFEKRLKREIAQLAPPDQTDGVSTNEEHAKKIIRDMDDVIHHLEEKLDLASDKDWNLLVCSIGAELEAFKEAQAILRRLLPQSEDGKPPSGASQDEEPQKKNTQEDHSQGQGWDAASETHADEPPPDLLRDVTSSPLQAQTASGRSEHEDDEPDPAWLLSDT
ncbi:hypothetical protein VTN49DRAFT_4068 [Thermomyces lanuginosus]|uniref:uncharacterized protein n=1 Tax=Thermomyces lanuginosus TaxID=5541 RepID=UPI0037431EA2